MSRLAALLVAVLLVASPAVTTAATAPTVDAPTITPSESTPTDDATEPAEDSTSNETGPAEPSTASETDSAEPSTATADNTTNRLAVPGPKTTNYSTVRLDFGGSMATSSERIGNEYRLEIAIQQIQTVESREAEEAIVGSYLDATVRELENISATERAAVERYRNGESRVETLLTRLAVVDARSRAIEASLNRLQRVAPPTAAPRIRRVKTELEAYQSPLRERVAAAVSGRLDEDAHVHVTASPNGYALETILDGNYHRNAVRFDDRNANGTDRINGDLGEIQDRLTELYPWGFDPKRITDYRTYPARSVYLTEFRHEQGDATVYLDGATQEPFREEQSLILSRLPVESVTTDAAENLTVDVTRTRHGGPVNVNTTSAVRSDDGNVSYEAVDVVVKVDGRVVGETGGDGDLWLIPPPGDYRITVVRGNTSVNVSVSP